MARREKTRRGSLELERLEDRILLATVTADLQAASDTGVASDDNITNDDTPTYDIIIVGGGGATPWTIQIDWENDAVWDVTDNTIVADGTYSYTAGSLADNTYTMQVQLIDGTGTYSDTDTYTIDTAVPGNPVAPDLQAASDTGVLSTDDITSDNTPTFDVTSTDTYYRFYDGAVLLSGQYETAATYTPGAQGDGAHSYNIIAVDAAGNVSAAASPNLAVTIDTAVPDVPGAPDLDAASDTGDPTDNITADTTPMFNVGAGAAYFRLYRDGGTVVSLAPILGDDGGIYKDTATPSETLGVQPFGTFDYTVSYLDVAGNESPQSAALSVTIAAVAPTGSHTYADGVVVTLYGTTLPDVAWDRTEFQPGVTDVLVNPGVDGDGIINSITFYGDGTQTQDIGITIENSNGLRRVVDVRSTPTPLAFIASQGPVNALNLRGDLSGINLNGMTAGGGWALPADLDGDGDTGDLTGLYVEGNLGIGILRVGSSSDIVVGGDVTNRIHSVGDMLGDVTVGGNAQAIRLYGGTYAGNVTVGGNAGYIHLYDAQAPITGDVDVGGALTCLYVRGNDWLGDLTAASIGRVYYCTPSGVLAGQGIYTTGGGGAAGQIGFLRVTSEVAGTVSATGDLGSVRVHGGVPATGLIESGAFTADGHAGTLYLLGDMAGAVNIATGLDCLYVRGQLSGGVTVQNGDLTRMTVSNPRLLALQNGAVDVQNGNMTAFCAYGTMADSTVDVSGALSYVTVYGDMNGSSVNANTFLRVAVSGQIAGVGEEVHALDGASRFCIRDHDQLALVSAANNHVLFGGLDAWVGIMVP